MKYIIYCRKSSESEDRQEQSIDSQEHELMAMAEKQKLTIVKILKESQSAKKVGRPIFNELLKMLSSGKADGVLCWKLDRLSRNPIDTGYVQSLLQDGVIKNIKTFERDYFPHDNILMMVFEMGMANQYIRDLSVNVKRGNREKLARGEWPNHAPFGYLNNKVDKSIVIDSVRAKYVKRAYELYLTSSHGFRDVARILYDEGLRTSSGKKVLISHIQRMLSNPFYCGIMLRDGKYYNGNHKPIISKSDFDKAQEILADKSRPKSQRLFFPLRGFLKCENCGCALTSSTKKGHDYYYCTNRKEKCDEHKSYMRETYLYEIFGNIFGSLAFSERKIDLMYKSAKEKIGIDSEYFDNALATLQNSLESLTTKESKLLDTFLADQISKELYDQKALDIHNERISLNKQIQEFKNKQPASMLEPTKNAFIQGNRAMKEFLDADNFKKRNIVENLCWNLSFKDKNVAQIKLKTPFDVMYKAPKNGTLSEMLGD
ncbi:MAG: hypothetical protein A2431_00575 [Candidatus Zambryskibacteria bacterium RIFOXYC1_FULL_39_10]|uniref:Recombinase domain-containing protein n=1 Tax=Candidatus Zambryskibacteria bacterium RIFOXYC1_FULL_39_10 TaxID=1802779 RepID=A0A1G2UZ89_9BACT|nr:MAG: hypothetical protein A2431_00575 [Candidatus Zambryskibacteria bacterium RIFOXYC1_FULL_39_10]OHB15639.1 MAG: hypothetical protein A2605_02435 [Candidatus Zambryskibacteria bacterium RIFOXYD1_FULL_39_35]